MVISAKLLITKLTAGLSEYFYILPVKNFCIKISINFKYLLCCDNLNLICTRYPILLVDLIICTLKLPTPLTKPAAHESFGITSDIIAGLATGAL